MLIDKILLFLKNNIKIVENYFSMTVLLILNSFFTIFLYPYLIKTLGSVAYGKYIFAMSIISYLSAIVIYGFERFGVREISINQSDIEKKSEIFSIIFISKLYLEIISILCFIIILFFIDEIELRYVTSICFFNTLFNILFPNWYYQGIQKMKIVTIVQVSFKILSVPFIFFFIKKPNDLVLFSFISTFFNFFAGLSAFFYLFYIEKLKFKFFGTSYIMDYLKKSLIFFKTSLGEIAKDQSLTIITGIAFGMHEVALFDLAKKVVIIPLSILTSINGAIFPQIIKKYNKTLIKKILNYETLISLLFVLLVILIGKYVVLILGGNKMIESYNLVIILSGTIYTWLLTGGYVNLVFLPQNENKYILVNQIFALFTMLVFIFLGLYLYKKIIIVPIAILLSAIFEVIYFKYIVWKKNLL